MTASKSTVAPKNRPYDASHYALTVRLNSAIGNFNNTVSVSLTAISALDQIELDCQDLKVTSVRLAPLKIELPFKQNHENHTLLITLDTPLKGGQNGIIEIDYQGQASTHHDGFFSVNDPDNQTRPKLYFTHFEALAARKFFPCNDEPYDKATSELIIETEPEYETLSNGRKVLDQTFTAADGSALRRTHWKQERPHSTYLICMAAGIFDKITSSAQGVPLEIYTAPGRAKDIEFAMDVMRRSLSFFESFYAVKYPWTHYGMVGVPGYLWGGMEHTTLSAMRESVMTIEDPSAQIQKLHIAAVTTHELAHQWFGNYVTMKWWDDIWLNEAFASYMETAAAENYFQNDFPLLETIAAAWENYFRQEDGPRSHAIISEDLPSPDDAFDSINYTKGEQVLRMLDFYIGRENFKKGINLYMTRYALSNATHKDFMAAMEEVSGENLQGFVKSWLLSRGYPVLTIKETWDATRQELTIDVKQKSNHADDSTIFDFKIPVTFHREHSPVMNESRTIHLRQKTQTLRLALKAKPEWITWNPSGAALVRIQRDAPDEEWALQAACDSDPVARLAALFELANPWMDRGAQEMGPLSNLARSAIHRSLKNDPSPYVRAIFAEKLLVGKWPRYPDYFAETLLEEAKNPSNLPPNDPVGRSFVQARYLALLGKSSHAGSRRHVYGLLKETSASLDIIAGAAWAMAGFSDLEAIESLKSALRWQSRRSYAFKKSILLVFGSIGHPSVIPEISGIFKSPDASNEIVGGILRRFGNNEILKNCAAGANFIGDFVIEPNSYNDQMKAGAIRCLEESKSPEVRPAIEAIAQKAATARLRALAQKVLDKNF
ncbi:MAG: hypothetical protein HY547_02745 [Elusimicrobia bacterium]|nr:hypothetical protein [Elusimicrobiota bacterium]